jgi:hypothetical protein
MGVHEGDDRPAALLRSGGGDLLLGAGDLKRISEAGGVGEAQDSLSAGFVNGT